MDKHIWKYTNVKLTSSLYADMDGDSWLGRDIVLSCDMIRAVDGRSSVAPWNVNCQRSIICIRNVGYTNLSSTEMGLQKQCLLHADKPDM